MSTNLVATSMTPCRRSSAGQVHNVTQSYSKFGLEIKHAQTDVIDLRALRLKAAQEGRAWLRSPCVSIAHWECPPGPLGAPWLLIEMCARSLVTDASAGCSTGPCSA